MKRIIFFFITILLLSPYSLASDLRVYDANDQELGIFAGFTDNNYGIEIFLQDSKRLVSLSTDDGAIYKIVDYLFFESSDCTGTPYLQAQTNKPIQEIFYSADFDNFVVISLNSQTINYKSWVAGGDCHPITGSTNLHAVIDFPLTDLPFVYPAQPPLRIEFYGGIAGDTDGDGDVDALDLQRFSQNYGTTP